MIGEGTSYPDLVHTTELTSEKYGVGCRKGSDLASYINSVFAEAYADGSSQEIAKKYGVQDSLLEQEPCEFKQSDSDSDVDYIKSIIPGLATIKIGQNVQTGGSRQSAAAPHAFINQSASTLPKRETDVSFSTLNKMLDIIAEQQKQMARLVGEKLGVDVEFVVIDWDNKVMELDSKKIDVVWNGMTLTDEVTKSMECTNAYCNNAQVVVVPEGK